MMIMNNLEIFHFNATPIRVVEIDGNPWFIASDVCKVLGIVNPTNAVRSLRPDEQTLQKIKGLRTGATNLVSESGLYKLIMRAHRSNPAAAQFQDWVTRVVLPAIRKDGAYVMGEEKVATGEMSEMNLMHNITTIDNEPRILDTDLAEALGIATPANIRKDLIAPNLEELEELGILGTRPINTGGRGRPGMAFFLNRDQAILVCILSRTTRAKKKNGSNHSYLLDIIHKSLSNPDIG